MAYVARLSAVKDDGRVYYKTTTEQKEPNIMAYANPVSLMAAYEGAIKTNVRDASMAFGLQQGAKYMVARLEAAGVTSLPISSGELSRRLHTLENMSIIDRMTIIATLRHAGLLTK